MWADDPDTRAALDALGLTSDASLAQAKAVFRRRAMALHPDTGGSSRDALSELAACLRAIRHLESVAPQQVEIALAADQAGCAHTRTIRLKDRIAVFRIPAGASDGDRLTAIGDDTVCARIRIRPAAGETPTATPASGLDSFIAEFATGAPAARFARWLRKARSAA
jgi:hypothetical protein